LNNLISKHASKGLLVDTNLLLLLFTGLWDRKRITESKRTNKYTPEDFDLLRRFVNHFHRIITTPGILAELSNLSPRTRGKYPQLAKYFSQLVKILQEAHEEYSGKDSILDSKLLPVIGFTDLSIMEAAKENKYLVLTDDLLMTKHLLDAGCEVINFTSAHKQSWFKK